MKLLITHKLPSEITREQLAGFAKVTQTDPNIKGLRSYVSLTQHKAVCLFEAASRERLAKWMEEHQMPYDDIWAVEVEGERGEFREVQSLVGAGAKET